jgi:hypothetical protein
MLSLKKAARTLWRRPTDISVKYLCGVTLNGKLWGEGRGRGEGLGHDVKNNFSLFAFGALAGEQRGVWYEL